MTDAVEQARAAVAAAEQANKVEQTSKPIRNIFDMRQSY